VRDLPSRMLTALLAGQGLRGIAEPAAEEMGRVAIVLPARGHAAASGDEIELGELSATLERGDLPGAEAQVPIENGGQLIGRALALAGETNGPPRVRIDREEILRTAGLATLAEIAASTPRRDRRRRSRQPARGSAELTGLDAALGEDRERLGLGLKAHRIVAPTLPR
jgi:hypothetical protein